MKEQEWIVKKTEIQGIFTHTTKHTRRIKTESIYLVCLSLLVNVCVYKTPECVPYKNNVLLFGIFVIQILWRRYLLSFVGYNNDTIMMREHIYLVHLFIEFNEFNSIIINWITNQQTKKNKKKNTIKKINSIVHEILEFFHSFSDFIKYIILCLCVQEFYMFTTAKSILTNHIVLYI